MADSMFHSQYKRYWLTQVRECEFLFHYGLFCFVCVFLPDIKSPTCPPACLGGFRFTEKDLEVLLFKLDNQQEEERSMSSTL